MFDQDHRTVDDDGHLVNVDTSFIYSGHDTGMLGEKALTSAVPFDLSMNSNVQSLLQPLLFFCIHEQDSIKSLLSFFFLCVHEMNNTGFISGVLYYISIK